MKNTFIRNSFVAPRNLAFSDKVLEASRKGAGAGSISFSYNHAAPSYPADVLANGACRGYIEPLGDGSDPELQKFVVTASGSSSGSGRSAASSLRMAGGYVSTSGGSKRYGLVVPFRFFPRLGRHAGGASGDSGTAIRSVRGWNVR